MNKLAVVRTHRLDDEPDTFPIVATVPIPPRYKGHPLSKLGRTMRALKVGDSFQVKKPTRGVSGIHRMAGRIGITIETRRLGEYIRIWRTA